MAATRMVSGAVAECVFQVPTRELAETVERIASARRAGVQTTPLDIASVRRSLVVERVEDGPWRRLLRRSG